MTALWVIVLCGALSIVYAIWATSSVMKADAGNARMQEIAAAVREGAQAYLKRQYTTIGMVGVVIFALLAYFLGTLVAVGFAIGRRRLHRHERFGSRQRSHRAGCHDLAGRRP
jgi:K(+)-stimulated pyrophosphate-energized sodium pump